MLTVQPDSAVLASGPSPDRKHLHAGAGGRPEPHGATPRSAPRPVAAVAGPGPRRQRQLRAQRADRERLKPGAEPRPLNTREAKASIEQTSLAEAHPDKRWSAASALTPDTFGWAILPEVGKPHELIATLAEPLTLADGETLQFVLMQNHGTEHTLGKFRLTRGERGDRSAGDAQKRAGRGAKSTV